MSLPESMSRIVIVGAQTHIDEVIDAMYDVKAIHLIDQTVGADEGFNLGKSRPYAAKASERLLKVRALEKALGISNTTKTTPVPVDEIKSKIESGSVELVETEVNAVLDKRNDLNQRITALDAEMKSLELLAGLPYDLEDYAGYKTIFSMVGTVAEDPSDALKGIDCEFKFVHDKKKGDLVAVFARNSDRDAVQEILASNGFTEISVPNRTGSATVVLTKVTEELEAANLENEAIDKEIGALFEEHKDFLSAADEELSILVEKGEIPIRIGNSEYTFVIDAWVPTKKVEVVKADLESKVEGVYVEIEETRGRRLKESEEAEPRFKTTPTKFNNGKVAKEFEYPTKLVSVPKYQEIDPTILIAIFLPLFFGFMVGDVGYAIPFIILGAYGLKVTHHKDWRAIATVLFFGGIWAFIFGMFFFGECLGMHFGGEVTGTEITWEAIFRGITGDQTFQLGENLEPILASEFGVRKLGDVTLLLRLSVYIGVVHLMLGYVCAVYNKSLQHGFKHAFLEKGGWILSFAGVVLACYSIAYMLIQDMEFVGPNLYLLIIGLVLIVVGVVMNFREEKAQAILELPGLVGNVLSYTRLAAIGMSKAGMALAFNYIAISMVGGLEILLPDGVEESLIYTVDVHTSIIFVILAIVLMVFMHLMIWTLAILSAGLHGLRLQYVELMAKFFEGGGEEYSPLRIKRNKTVSTKTVKEV